MPNLHKQLSTGIVPVYSIMIFWASETSIMSLFTLTACIAILLALFGTISVPLGREQLMWILYSTLVCQAMTMITDFNYDAYGLDKFLYPIEIYVLIFANAAMIGFMLNHPVLYLCGWLYGFYFIMDGLLKLLLNDARTGFIKIGLGKIIGYGTVNLGSNLIKYRSKIIYTCKRLCFILNNTIQQRMTAHQRTTTTQLQQQRYQSRVSVPTGGSNSTNTAGSVDVDIDMTSSLLNNTHTQ